MTNKYVIGKDEPVEQSVHVWLEERGSAVALRARCGAVSQTIALLKSDGRLASIPLDRDAARALGLTTDTSGRIAVIPGA